MALELSIAETTLAAFRDNCAELKGIQRGIEKESLRVTVDGALSRQPHPLNLGSPLTHPHITTDFSEAQLELITDVQSTPEACVRQLSRAPSRCPATGSGCWSDAAWRRGCPPRTPRR